MVTVSYKSSCLEDFYYLISQEAVLDTMFDITRFRVDHFDVVRMMTEAFCTDEEERVEIQQKHCKFEGSAFDIRKSEVCRAEISE